MNLRTQSDVIRFKTSAERYCTLLESAVDDPNVWIEEILKATALIYAYACALPEVDIPDEAPDIPEDIDIKLDERKEIYTAIKNILGPHASYWAYFDPSEPPESSAEPVFGDLADDLADIYRDIKPGLLAWALNNDAYLSEIVFNWKIPLFGSHWGVHAVSAMRALHPLVYLRGIED